MTIKIGQRINASDLLFLMVPPIRFERTTPALGGLVQRLHLGKVMFRQISITARKLPILTFHHISIRFHFHTYFTPVSVARVKYLR